MAAQEDGNGGVVPALCLPTTYLRGPDNALKVGDNFLYALMQRAEYAGCRERHRALGHADALLFVWHAGGGADGSSGAFAACAHAVVSTSRGDFSIISVASRAGMRAAHWRVSFGLIGARRRI